MYMLQLYSGITVKYICFEFRGILTCRFPRLAMVKNHHLLLLIQDNVDRVLARHLHSIDAKYIQRKVCLWTASALLSVGSRTPTSPRHTMQEPSPEHG